MVEDSSCTVDASGRRSGYVSTAAGGVGTGEGDYERCEGVGGE